MKQEQKENILNDFYKKCRQVRLSVTPQRLAIYNCLIGSNDHPSPEMIFKRIKSDFPTISFATVYKTLETFESKNIISKVTNLHNTLRYDPLTKRHHHIICKRCHKVIDLSSVELNSLPIPSQVTDGNVLIDFSVHFDVICAECKEKE